MQKWVLLLACTVTFCAFRLSAEERTTITPPPTTNVLRNPGKGWSVMGDFERQPDEVKAFAAMGVRRFAWMDLEPREGDFQWQALDQFLAGWANAGGVCNIGVMCASTHTRDTNGYCTPKWVFDAGAQKTEIDLSPKRVTSGTPGHKIAPVFDDPIFLAKLGHFLKAFAARYDGDPRIAVLDIRSYGNWGEAHMSPFGIPDIAPEKFREHVQMHLDAFKKTQLCLSRNAHLGRFGKLKEVFDWAVLEHRVAPRRDGICGNSDGRETAIGLGLAPGVFEFFGDYPFTKERGWWEGKKDKDGLGFTLAECIENGHPTWVDLARGGKSGLQMLQENRDLIERLSNRIGYHFHLARASFPTRTNNRAIDLELSMTNSGVAPIYIPCAVAVSLRDSAGQRAKVVWPAAFRPAEWAPDQVTTQSARLSFDDASAGDYVLELALVKTPGETSPWVRLGTELPQTDGWYTLGKVKLE